MADAAMEEARKAMIAKRFGGSTLGARTGGTGTTRRKTKGASRGGGDDKKLSGVLKKMGLSELKGVEEANIIKDDGTCIHIRQPKIQTSVPSNTYVINGNAETKKLEELLPGILTQLGEESMDYLRAFAERSGAMGAMGGAAATMPDDEDDDDQVPELVENFEEAASK